MTVECGFGYIATLSQSRKAQGAGITKLAKSLQTEQWPPHFKRIRHSQDWPVLERKGLPDGWRCWKLVDSTQLGATMQEWRSDGFSVHLVDGQCAWDIVASIG
jgi:hypothetical protein